MNIEELKETANALAQTTPEDTEEMALICAELHSARDLEDEISKEERAACADLERKLAELREPFRAQKAAAHAVVEAATGALVRRIEADEQATLDAVNAGANVPSPLPLPKGLRVTRKTVLAGIDNALLPDTFYTRVPDAQAILKAAEAGHDVPGAIIETKLGCVYTRGKK